VISRVFSSKFSADCSLNFRFRSLQAQCMIRQFHEFFNVIFGGFWLKSADNKFTRCGFTSSFMQVSANSHNFRFRSLCVLCFTFKICQIVAGTCMIRQFHEFFNQIFGGFFEVWPNASTEGCFRDF